MRRVVRSRTFVAQLQVFLEQGIAAFGTAVARRTLARIDRAIDQHLANFPAAKTRDARLGLTVYHVTRTPFVILYDYDDAELRVHFIMPARADRRDLDPSSAEW
jgi:plasmid stabilization system protein ParE